MELELASEGAPSRDDVPVGQLDGSEGDTDHTHDDVQSLGDGISDIDEADIEEALKHLDSKDRKIIALMAELEEERERRKKMNSDIFRIKERVGKDISRLEETIAEQEATNERLKATLLLRQEEAEIMSQILKVRDKEISVAAKQVGESEFQMDCLRGDIAELKDQLAQRDALIRELSEGASVATAAKSVASDVEDVKDTILPSHHQPELSKLKDTVRQLEAEVLCYQQHLMSLEGHSVGEPRPLPPNRAAKLIETRKSSDLNATTLQQLNAIVASVRGLSEQAAAHRLLDVSVDQGQENAGAPRESVAGNQEESDDDLMEQFRVPRIIRQSPIDGLLPHIPSSPTQLDSDASLTELLQGVQESVVTVVTSAVDTMASMKRRMQDIAQERDEHWDSLTQAGEFGQFLLLENETLKRHTAELQRTLVLTSSAPGHGSSPGSGPFSTPVRASAHSLTQGSPSSQSPGTGTLLLRSPNVLANNDEALLTQIAAYKRVADELQRKNTSLEREHARVMDALRALDDELASTRQRLEEYQSKYEELDKQAGDLSTSLSKARLDVLDARAESSALRQELETSKHAVSRLQVALQQECTLANSLMPSPTKPGSAVDADLQAALEETRAELEAAKSLADDRLEEVQACMSKWQQDREELLHANNRLHEERLELRSILDSERQRLSDVVTSRDLTKPELVRLTSETASLKDELDATRRKLARVESESAESVKSLQALLARRDSEVMVLGEKIIELSAELEGLMGRTLTISQLKTQMSALEAELNADKTLLRKYKEELKEKQSWIKHLEHDRSRLREALSEVTKSQQSSHRPPELPVEEPYSKVVTRPVGVDEPTRGRNNKRLSAVEISGRSLSPTSTSPARPAYHVAVQKVVHVDPPPPPPVVHHKQVFAQSLPDATPEQWLGDGNTLPALSPSGLRSRAPPVMRTQSSEALDLDMRASAILDAIDVGGDLPSPSQVLDGTSESVVSPDVTRKAAPIRAKLELVSRHRDRSTSVDPQRAESRPKEKPPVTTNSGLSPRRPVPDARPVLLSDRQRAAEAKFLLRTRAKSNPRGSNLP